MSIERGRITLYPPPPQQQQQGGKSPVSGPARGERGAALAAAFHAVPPEERRQLVLALARQRQAHLLLSRARAMPPPGTGLNQPALLTFRRMAVRQKDDRRTVDAFRGKLAEASARLNGLFVHYDPDDGVWLLKLDSWL